MSQNKFTTNNNPTIVAVSNADGETPVYLYADPVTHGLVISGTINVAADGAMLDGVSSSIRATVFDLTNSNPQSVAIVDTNGDQISSFGGGTQYTEDAAAAANPVGTALNLIRADTPATITSTDGDNVAQRGTNYGAAYTQIITSGGAFVDTFGGGTQYTDGDADATPTGTVALGFDGANVRALTTDAAGDLQVDVLTMPTVAVTQSGTWDEVGINDSGNSITVDNPQLSVVGGGAEATAMRVTIANDSTGVLSVDDNGGSLTVDGSVTVSATNLDIRDIDAATDDITVHGDVGVLDQLDLTNSNPAVVAIVDGSGDQITSFGGGTQYTDGDADATPTGTVALGFDGSNVQALATDATGNLQVDILNSSIPVTDNGGSLTVDGTVTANAGSGTFTVAGAVTNTVLSVVGGGTEATAQRVTIANDSTGVLSVDDNGSSLTVDGTVTANAGSGTFTVAGAVTNTVLSVVGGGTEATAQRVTIANDSTGVLSVDDNGASLTVDGTVTANAGTNLNTSALALEAGGNLAAAATSLATLDNIVSGSEAQVDIVAALPAGTNNIGDVDILSIVPGTGATNQGKAEDAGHSSGDTGVFALAVRNDTPNTAVTNADADYSQVSVSKVGSVRIAPPEDDFAALGSNHVKKYYTNAGAVTDGIVWSPAAGKRWYVTDIFVNVSAASTVTLEDDLAAGDSPVFKAELAANSGWSHSFSTPLFSGEDAADLLITTTAGNVYVTVTGYEI